LNNFYTVLVIPEKTKQVKKVVLPSVYVRVGLLLGSVGVFFLAFMVYDYVNVMRQLSENKRLQTENRQLKQQMQAFTTKLQTVQDALERIQSYTTKLRIITNQAGDNTENLKKKVAPDIPGLPMDDHSDLPPAKAIPSGRESRLQRLPQPQRHHSAFERSRLLAALNDEIAVDVAESNEEMLISENRAAAEDSASAQPAATPAAPAVESPAVAPAPPVADPMAPPAAPVAKPKRKPREPVVNSSATSLSTTTATTPLSTASSASTSTSTSSASSGPADSAAATDGTVSASPPVPAAPVAPPKKLSDLIREDEERESAALRSEFAKLHLAFDSVLQHALAVELDVESLTTALLDQRDYMNSLPTLKPTNGWYTSGFGVRSSPFTGKSTMHEGLDLANHIGSAIVSAAAGVVTYAGPRPGYGNLVTINHGYGIQTQYGHISRAYVKVGEKVKRGQKIAAVGNTGRSTGPHVHYEVRVNGIPMDPYYYILEE
jgi:murein DD-endopeptidase MepM/ murein hydrolase activator NlpD